MFAENPFFGKKQMARILTVLALGGMIMALLLGMGVTRGLADGGIRPTNTPTVTPTLPSLVIATSTLPFNPFPTRTPTVVSAFVPLELTPMPEQLASAQETGEGGGMPLLCWPLAISFILVVIIVSTVLLRRRAM